MAMMIQSRGVEPIHSSFDAAATRDDIKSIRGALRRSGQRLVSLEQMQEAIEAGDGR